MDLNLTSVGGLTLSVDSTIVYIVIGLYCLTSITGCLASLVIAVTIIKSKTLRTAMNVTLVNLAIADIFVSVVNIPLRIILASGVISTDLCLIDVFVQTMCDCVKPAMLAATSFERYQSIAKPLESRGKFRRTIMTVVMSWVLAFCVGVVSVVVTVDGVTLYPCSIAEHRYASGVERHTRHTDTIYNFRELLITLPAGLICLMLVTVFYYLMIKTLNEHSKNMAKKPKAFKNKIKPAATKNPNRSFKLKKNKDEATKGATDKADAGTNGQAWKNEQYTETEKGENQSSHSKGSDTKDAEAGTSAENTTCVVGDTKPEGGDNLHNIADVVSLVSTASKRFTVRETRKNLLRTMKKHRLIGNNPKRFGTSLSAPESTTHTIDENVTSEAKHRYSHELPSMTTNGNSALHEGDEDIASSVFKSLALNLREHRLFGRRKQQRKIVPVIASNIDSVSIKREDASDLVLKDNAIVDVKPQSSVKTGLGGLTSTTGLHIGKNGSSADHVTDSIATPHTAGDKITSEERTTFETGDSNQTSVKHLPQIDIDTGVHTLNKTQTSLESPYNAKFTPSCEPNMVNCGIKSPNIDVVSEHFVTNECEGKTTDSNSNTNDANNENDDSVDKSVMKIFVNSCNSTVISEPQQTNEAHNHSLVNASVRGESERITDDTPNGPDTACTDSLYSKDIPEPNKTSEQNAQVELNAPMDIDANQDNDPATVTRVRHSNKSTDTIEVTDTTSAVPPDSKGISDSIETDKTADIVENITSVAIGAKSDNGTDTVALVKRHNNAHNIDIVDTECAVPLSSTGISEPNKTSDIGDNEPATVTLVKRANKTAHEIDVVDIGNTVSLSNSKGISEPNKTRDNIDNETATVTLVKRPKKAAHKIDVVDMDGTVHKRVEVQGSVTGAVCVFNSSNKVQGRRKVEMRAAKRIAALIGSFVILWLPLPLSVIFVVCQGQITQASVEMLMVMGSISAMTTAVNPLLNLLLNKQIRSAARSSVRRGFSVLRKRYS